jgi:hypothetical protein
LSICGYEDVEEDFSVTSTGPLTLFCGDPIPDPGYILGDSWPDNTTVNWDVVLSEDCNGESLYIIDVFDANGNSATIEELLFIIDDTAPSLIVGADMTLSCQGEIPEPSFEVFDACSALLWRLKKC